MGGPNDHWYTDLFVWNRAVFGEPIDSYLRDIRRFGGDHLLRDDGKLSPRLWDLWPQWGKVDTAALAVLADELAVLRNQLHRQAEAEGWGD